VKRPRHHLTAAELAEAALLGDLAVVLIVLGWVLPGGGLFQVAACTPFAALAARRRTRAVVLGTLAAMTVSFLLTGPGGASNLLLAALFGWPIGKGLRRGWGPVRTVVIALLVGWTSFSAGTVLTLLVFTRLRKLALKQIKASWTGMAKLIRQLGLEQVAHRGDQINKWTIEYWWIAIPAVLLVLGIGYTLISRVLARPALERLERALGAPATDAPAAAGLDLAPGPVPASLDDVVVRYPGSEREALPATSLLIPAGAYVAVLGENGSGKTTLGRLLAGRSPTAGSIRRPGSAGLGRPGGTAVVSQRPESQVLGVRVADDIVWGMADPDNVDVAGLLNAVGLAGFEGRETSTLSGGELQRLAIAAALARNPALLISDESTAMVDPEGRTQIVDLLRRLPEEQGLTVVHITHLIPESQGADLVVVLKRDAAEAASRSPHRSLSLVRLEGVGHVYGLGTPWAHRALTGVDLEIGEGDRLLVVGHNGSGKSTLAWVLAGLVHPSEGVATAVAANKPLDEVRGLAGIAFQHARLQLFRSTVEGDIRYGTELDDADVDRALDLVGLDPGRFRNRRVDRLSGGEQRRVALAGLLARQPKLLILDEPLAGLDPTSRKVLIDVLVGLRDRTGAATVIVTHDLDAAAELGDRILRLEGGRVVSDEQISERRTS
jgi:energy-coupling factor transporter ATP-binding protein EcfA2